MVAAMQFALNLPNPLAARQSLFAHHGHPITTSREVAKRFGKQHKNVLRAIEQVLVDSPDPQFSRLNFEPRDYVDGRGKTYPEYLLTHNGFALLAMRFTGREAMAWQIAFLDAFNAMEAELHERTERFAAALDIVRPALRPVVDGTEKGLARTVIAAPLGRSPASVTYHRRVARRLGLIKQRPSEAA
jgi:Rha family phage regulatory protein